MSYTSTNITQGRARTQMPPGHLDTAYILGPHPVNQPGNVAGWEKAGWHLSGVASGWVAPRCYLVHPAFSRAASGCLGGMWVATGRRRGSLSA